MTLMIAVMVLMQTLMPQPAYLLDHPIDENLLILATQDGRFQIALLSGGCQWVHSDMNVQIDQVQDIVAHISHGPNDGCVVVLGERVDQTPCFANAAGECDVDSGEHYWPDS